MKSRGPWQIKQSTDVYKDPWIRVQRDDVLRPDGQDGTYATVHLRSGVCVIAAERDNTLHLTSEFHYAVGRYTIEGVSGGIEDGEEPRIAAQRELEEELGLKAERWTHLGTIDPFTAAIYSTVDLYLAQELTECAAIPEGTELIERVSFPLAEAVQMVRDSKITHAPTCTALLRIALDASTLLHR